MITITLIYLQRFANIKSRVTSAEPLSIGIDKLQTREEAKRLASKKKQEEEEKREKNEQAKRATESDDSNDQLPTPPASRATSEAPALDSLHISDDTKSSDAKENLAESEEDPLPRDPLSWFGILVPPALRSAQGSFAQAVECLPRLAEVSREMRLLESEIGRSRKDLKRASG
jgi:coiled-coil domain-containing protein 115